MWYCVVSRLRKVGSLRGSANPAERATSGQYNATLDLARDATVVTSTSAPAGTSGRCNASL